MRCGKTGKVRHTSKSAARNAMRVVNKADMNAYRCQFCKGWHLGHSNRDFDRQKRISQLLGAQP